MKLTALILISLTGVSFLAGCATPFRDYAGTGQRVAMANLCEREKLISTSAFNRYAAYQFGEYAHQNMQIVDVDRLHAAYLNNVEFTTKLMTNPAPHVREQLRLSCAEIATVAMRLEAAQSTNVPQYVLPIPTTTTTNCLTTYGFTRCTTN